MRIAEILLTCLGMLVVGHAMRSPEMGHGMTRWCGGGDCDRAHPFTAHGYDYEVLFEGDGVTSPNWRGYKGANHR